MHFVDELRHVCPAVDPDTGHILEWSNDLEYVRPLILELLARTPERLTRSWRKIPVDGATDAERLESVYNRFIRIWLEYACIIRRDPATMLPHAIGIVVLRHSTEVRWNLIVGALVSSNEAPTVRRALWDIGIRRTAGSWYDAPPSHRARLSRLGLQVVDNTDDNPIIVDTFYEMVNRP